MSFGTWDVRFLESVAPWSFSGGNVARITVVLLWIPTSTSDGGGQWLRAWRLAARSRHESISFVDENLDMANAFGSLDRKKHGRRDATYTSKD